MRNNDIPRQSLWTWHRQTDESVNFILIRTPIQFGIFIFIFFYVWTVNCEVAACSQKHHKTHSIIMINVAFVSGCHDCPSNCQFMRQYLQIANEHRLRPYVENTERGKWVQTSDHCIHRKNVVYSESHRITKINWYRLEIISFANLKRFQFISCECDWVLGWVCEHSIRIFKQTEWEKQKQTNKSIAVLSIRWFQKRQRAQQQLE